MAKSSAELERELEVKRQQLHARTTRLRERVADDIGGVRNEAQDQVEATKHKARSYFHEAEGKAVEHPWATVALGLGAGVALGMMAHGSGRNHHSSSGSGDGSHAAGQGESLLARGFGAFMGSAGGPIIDEVRQQLNEPLEEIKVAVQDSISELVHGITEGITGSNNGSSHRQKVRDHVAA